MPVERTRQLNSLTFRHVRFWGTLMTDYASLADDFYINMNLNTEMALPAGRDTTLSFFERCPQAVFDHAELLHPREW